VSTPTLHPAQNRGLRELYATARNLAGHWGALAPRFEGTPAGKALADGAARGGELMDELPAVTEPYGLYVGAAARQAGASLSGVRGGVADRFLERNQALRAAVLDAQHMTTLCGYLAQLADTRGTTDVAEFCHRWERQIASVERAARRAAMRLGREPDLALERLDDSAAGRAAHGAAYWAGTVGEWFDRRRGSNG
jgi:hypothetical protein